MLADITHNYSKRSSYCLLFTAYMLLQLMPSLGYNGHECRAVAKKYRAMRE